MRAGGSGLRSGPHHPPSSSSTASTAAAAAASGVERMDDDGERRRLVVAAVTPPVPVTPPSSSAVPMSISTGAESPLLGGGGSSSSSLNGCDVSSTSTSPPDRSDGGGGVVDATCCGRFGGGGRRSRNRDHGALISALSNLSIQYNMSVIAPALMLLDPRGTTYAPGGPAYPRSDEADSLLKSAVFAGAVAGQCTMGLLGDAVGLERAMLMTNCISLLGTVGCTVAPLVAGGSSDSIYTFIAVFRAVLGVGVGGKYPLASAMRAESAESGHGGATPEGSKHHRAREVARGFFWQTPGAILPYVVSLALLLAMGGDDSSGGNGGDGMVGANVVAQYGILVGVGVFPSAAVLVLTWDQLRHRQRGGGGGGGGTARPRSSGHVVRLRSVLRSRVILYKLVGTGMSWFVYDVVYFGTAFNQPEILARVFHGSSLLANSLQNVVVASMGLPGVLCAIWMIEPMGPKRLQVWGFVAIGAASALLALCVGADGVIGRGMAFVTCCILIFALNWGCNVSTYVLPMEAFPRDIRSSLHGISAGLGKLGALFGSFFFSRLNDELGMSFTFSVSAMFCVVGVWLTWQFVEPFRRDGFMISRRVVGFVEDGI